MTDDWAKREIRRLWAEGAGVSGGWTRPVCDDCWTREHGEQIPVRLRDLYRVEEECGLCGRPTMSGIYDRADPKQRTAARRRDRW